MKYHDANLPLLADKVRCGAPYIFEGSETACRSMHRTWTKMKSDAALASIVAGDPTDPLYGLGAYYDHRLTLCENERSQQYNLIIERARDENGNPIVIPTAAMALFRGCVQSIIAPVSVQHLHVIQKRLFKNKNIPIETRQLILAACIHKVGPKQSRVDPGQLSFSRVD